MSAERHPLPRAGHGDADEEVKGAYGIRFIASVSEEDVGTYEKKTYEIREE